MPMAEIISDESENASTPEKPTPNIVAEPVVNYKKTGK